MSVNDRIRMDERVLGPRPLWPTLPFSSPLPYSLMTIAHVKQVRWERRGTVSRWYRAGSEFMWVSGRKNKGRVREAARLYVSVLLPRFAIYITRTLLVFPSLSIFLLTTRSLSLLGETSPLDVSNVYRSAMRNFDVETSQQKPRENLWNWSKKN